MYRKIASLFILLLMLNGCSAFPGTSETSTDKIVIKQAAISGTIVDINDKALISQLVITGNDYFARINTDFLGRFSIVLPLGDYQFEISKGSEYERKTINVNVDDRKAKHLDKIELKKLYETNWIAGDLHQHSVYSFDGADSPSDILLSDLSMGLKFGVITDHNDIRANAEFLNASLEGFIPFAGIEITTDRGHYNAINFNRIIDVNVSHGAADIQRIVDDIRKCNSAIVQINHPMRSDNNFTFQDWKLIKKFDMLEIWNGKSMPPYVEGEPNALTLQKWFELLDEGIFIPATAGSDNHDISGNKLFSSSNYKSADERYFMTSMFSGMPRTYVYLDVPTSDNVLKAILKGNSFLTNNPLAYLDINGAIPGENVSEGQDDINIIIQSNRPLTNIRIVKNSQTLYKEDVTGNIVKKTLNTCLKKGDWVVLEVCGENGDYAITNPVFIK